MTIIAKGIDVSAHNGVIDWNAVAASGVDYAIIRAGWSGHQGDIVQDANFLENMLAAKAAGLEVGVYLYAYDLTPKAAQAAADQLAEMLQPFALGYPVYYDQEDPKLLALTKQQRTDVAKAFLQRIEQHGYYAALYSFTSWLDHQLDMSQLKAFDVWVAQYAAQCTFKGSYGMWQHTVIGTQGIKGKHYFTLGTQAGVAGNCDLNVCYKDYPAIMRQKGCNGFDAAPVHAAKKSLSVAELRQMGFEALCL